MHTYIRTHCIISGRGYQCNDARVRVLAQRHANRTAAPQDLRHFARYFCTIKASKLRHFVPAKQVNSAFRHRTDSAPPSTLRHYCGFTAAYCCFTAARLGSSYPAALLRYCCFTAALLLLYCCFTAALQLLYKCFTALLVQDSGPPSTRACPTQLPTPSLRRRAGGSSERR